jgi:hypothetical protein
VQHFGEAWLSLWMGHQLDRGGAEARRWLDGAVQGQAQRAAESGWPRAEPDRARAQRPVRWRVEAPGGRGGRPMEEPSGRSGRPVEEVDGVRAWRKPASGTEDTCDRRRRWRWCTCREAVAQEMVSTWKRAAVARHGWCAEAGGGSVVA